MKKEKYCVEGMHCKSCEIYIQSHLKDVRGIYNIKTDSNKKTLTFESKDGMDSKEIIERINSEIKKDGYRIDKELNKEDKNTSNILISFLLAVVIITLFWTLQTVGIGNNLFSSELTLPMIFLLGVVASVSSCMAVVGALVLSFSSMISRKEYFKQSIAIFHISRLIVFFVLGGLLGTLGSLILLTQEIQLLVNILLFVVMIILALDMLDIFKISQITLPKSISLKILESKKSGYILTPILFGLASFFLPCGFTQSMQIHSILTESFLSGALTMLAFALGTLPVLLLISSSSKYLAQSNSKDIFYKVSGFLVLFFALYNLYGSLVANGLIQPIF